MRTSIQSCESRRRQQPLWPTIRLRHICISRLQENGHREQSKALEIIRMELLAYGVELGRGADIQLAQRKQVTTVEGEPLSSRSK